MVACRILIIDDDIDDLEILSEALHNKGIDSVYTVPSAGKAIEYLNKCEKEEELPKLIVTDLYLPALNGFDFIKGLKQVKLFSKIPVVVLSSLKFDLVKDLNQKIDADDYIKKPNSYKEYLEIAANLNRRIVA